MVKNTYFIYNSWILEDSLVAKQRKPLRALIHRADVIVFIHGNKSGYDLKTDWVTQRDDAQFGH